MQSCPNPSQPEFPDKQGISGNQPDPDGLQIETGTVSGALRTRLPLL
jgi:hypothetical protein